MVYYLQNSVDLNYLRRNPHGNAHYSRNPQPTIPHRSRRGRGLHPGLRRETAALEEALKGTTLSLADGAVLAAMNLADRCCKERQVTDNLRAQLKEALDENARLSKEMGDRRKKAKPSSKGETE